MGARFSNRWVAGDVGTNEEICPRGVRVLPNLSGQNRKVDALGWYPLSSILY